MEKTFQTDQLININTSVSLSDRNPFTKSSELLKVSAINRVIAIFINPKLTVLETTILPPATVLSYWNARKVKHAKYKLSIQPSADGGSLFTISKERNDFLLNRF